MVFIYLSVFLSLILIFLLIVVDKHTKPIHLHQDNLPLISVLIAARNEEKNIRACLNALLNQNYPKDKIEILIGDDQSDDKTALYIKEFVQKHDIFNYFLIPESTTQAKGKANVLASLAKKASGVFFLITDADIQVNPSWCINMTSLAIKNKIDILTGVTHINKKTFFDALQNIDWIYSLGLMKSVSDLGIPLTSMGNNMLITKEFYFKTGGYEKIPFSVTEDLALFQAVIKIGGTFYNDFTERTLVKSKAVPNFKSLLEQRKRWMKGCFDTPWFMIILLVLQAFFYPLFLFFLFLNPISTIVFGTVKYLTQLFFINFFLKKINHKVKVKELLLYEVYSAILSSILLLYFFLPTGVVWKGRKY